jgi:rubrerythrin
MSLAKTFYLIKNAEVQASELYTLIGLSVSIAHPELSDLFNSLADDEKLHAKQIEFIREIFLESGESFLENPEAEEMIGEFIKELETAKNHFNQHYAELQPRDLIQMAMGLEKNLLEKHRLFFMKVDDPQIKSLLESLNLADTSHIKKLHEFLLD